jgi:hypothetical protein
MAIQHLGLTSGCRSVGAKRRQIPAVTFERMGRQSPFYAEMVEKGVNHARLAYDTMRGLFVRFVPHACAFEVAVPPY